MRQNLTLEWYITNPLPQVPYVPEKYTRKEFLLGPWTLGASGTGTGEESGEARLVCLRMPYHQMLNKLSPIQPHESALRSVLVAAYCSILRHKLMRVKPFYIIAQRWGQGYSDIGSMTMEQGPIRGFAVPGSPLGQAVGEDAPSSAMFVAHQTARTLGVTVGVSVLS